MKSIEELVKDLPEVYQRIYSHPEYDGASRLCQDREIYIVDVVKNLQKKLGKTDLKVLDIGCAQGYFSLTLAKLGCNVRGVDFCGQNINLCRALAEENGLNCSFEHEKVTQEFSDELDDDYDVVLLLSVIHHSCNESGFDYARKIVETLSRKSKIIITELAVKAEPVYWNKNLPESYEEWFKNIAFFDELDFFETHLSGVKRPLIICSSVFFYSNGEFHEFKSWSKKAYDLKLEDDSRRYYFSDDSLMKIYRGKTEFFWNEMQTEIDFIEKEDMDFLPKLIFSDKNEIRIMLGEKINRGKLLLDAIAAGDEIDFDSVFDDVLDNLIDLERKGYYHGDLRSWNVCLKGKNAFLIDFGSIQTSIEDSVARAMNPKSDFTVYDAFVMLVYDSIIGSTYSSIKSSGLYGIRLFYDFARLPKSYCNFIKSYLLCEKSTVNYSRIKELFTVCVKNSTDVDFSQDEERIVLYELLRRAFYESSSELEARMLDSRESRHATAFSQALEGHSRSIKSLSDAQNKQDENRKLLDLKIGAIGESFRKLSENRLSDYQFCSNAVAEVTDGVVLENFYEPEDWGRWAMAPICSVLFRGGQISKAGKYAALCFKAKSFHSSRTVKVSLNGFVVADFEISTSNAEYRIPLPFEYISQSENRVAFSGEGDFESPKELGLSADGRKLFLAFKNICIENPLFEIAEKQEARLASVNESVCEHDSRISVICASLSEQVDRLSIADESIVAAEKLLSVHDEKIDKSKVAISAQSDLLAKQGELIERLQRENADLKKLVMFTKNHTLWGVCARIWHKIGKIIRRR